MKPDEIHKQLRDGKEVVVKLNNKPYKNTVGCPHVWAQTTSTEAECKKCGLGTWGHVEDGSIVS